MSTLKTNNLEHLDASSPNITLGIGGGVNISGISTLSNVVVGGATTELLVNGDARVTGILTVGTSSLTLNGDSSTISGITTINSVSLPSTGALSNRNMIINGAMEVAERATSVTSIVNIATTYATIDRMYHAFNSYGAWTSTQESDGPDGFSKSWKVNCTTANSVLTDTDYAILLYRVEGQDLQHLKYGTSSAEDTVISFWVKSNKTGAASFEVSQPDNSNKQFCTSYTINAANTWEYKTITIPGDTAGVIDDNNDRGLQMHWWLGSGSRYTGGTHATTWEVDTDVNRNATDLACGMTDGDYFQITGIQWELGTQATPFEHRSIGDEMKRCQRYYQKSYSSDTSPGSVSQLGAHMVHIFATGNTFRYTIKFNVTMRSTPTLTIYNPETGTVGSGGFEGNGDTNAEVISSTFRNEKSLLLFNTSMDNTGSFYWQYQLDAEL